MISFGQLPKHIQTNINPFETLLVDVSGLSDRQRLLKAKKLIVEAKKSIITIEAKIKEPSVKTTVQPALKEAGNLPIAGVSIIIEDEVEKEIIREKIRRILPIVKETEKFINEVEKGIRVEAEKVALGSSWLANGVFSFTTSKKLNEQEYSSKLSFLIATIQALLSDVMLPSGLTDALLKLRQALMVLPTAKNTIPNDKNEKGNLEVYIAKKVVRLLKIMGPTYITMFLCVPEA